MQTLHAIIGTSPIHVAWWQVMVRAAFVFCYAMLLFRLAPRHSFGRSTALDIVLAMILGSALSRTMTSNAPLVPTFAGSALLVALHSLLARLSVFSGRLGRMFTGSAIRLVRDGEIDGRAMRRASISPRDLAEALRLQAGVTDPAAVKEVYLERSGEISVIPKG